MFSKRTKWPVLIFCLLISACSAALYIPTQENAEKSGVAIDELVKGRELYTKYCGSCHNLYLPARFAKSHWTKEMPEMQQKAKIGSAESDLILKYILAGSNQE